MINAVITWVQVSVAAALSFEAAERSAALSFERAQVVAQSGFENVSGAPPVNTVLPAISGTVRGGETLTCSQGTWTGADSYAYQWLQDGAPIIGATSSALIVTPSMIPSLLGCIVTATGAGSTDATANAVSSPLRAIYQIDPDARVWTHQQGIASAVGLGVEQWLSADGLYTLEQLVTSNQPTRDAAGIDFDGLTDHLTSDACAALHNDAYTSLVGVTNLVTDNFTRTLWSSATNGVSAATRRISSVNLSLGTAASLTRMRFLLGGNSSAAQVDLRDLYVLGASHSYNLAFRSVAPGTGNGEALRLTDPLVSLDELAWPTVGMANNLYTFGAQRIVSGTATQPWQGRARYLIIITKLCSDAELDQIRDALELEGLL